jgi:hypothetical protein
MRVIIETDSQNNAKMINISKGIDYLIRIFDMEKPNLSIPELKYLHNHIKNYLGNRTMIEEKIKKGEFK